MFRLMRLKPPHGWIAVAWELAIVTLGVLLALAAQQWVENRTLEGKVEASKAALRDELSEHYAYAVEFRTVYPCVKTQLRRLLDRVVSSGAVIDPVPIYKEQTFRYVLRFPSKSYPTDTWEAAVSDGLIQRFEPSLRRQLAGHYTQMTTIVRNLISANNDAEQGLLALTHRLPIESAVRYSIVREMEQLGARLDYLDLIHGQVIDYIQNAGMLPPADEARALTERYGTYQFCKAQGLRMRSFKEAMQAVPN